MSSDITDFNTYSHSALRKMVQGLNSGDVMAASDPWRRASETLKQIRTALDTASNSATDSWQGASSNAFYDKMTKLANSVNNTASYANDAANTLQMMSEAIDQAKHDMPEEPGFWSQVGNAISDTAQNAVGIQDDSTQTPIKDQKKAEAVAVMQTLANKYRTATPVLKPPAMAIDEQDVPPPDPTPSAALTAFVMGAGLGAVGGYVTAPENTQVVSRVTDGRTAPAVAAPRARTVEAVAPSDSGIKGGLANPAPKPLKSVAVGADAPASSQSVSPTAGPSTPPAQPQTVGGGTGLDSTGVIGGKAPLAGSTGIPGSPVGGGAANSSSLSMGFGGTPGRSFAMGPPASAGIAPGEAEMGQRASAGASESVSAGEGAGESAAGRAGGFARGGMVGGAVGERPSGARAGGFARGRAAREGSGGVIGEDEMVGGRAASGPRESFTEGGTGLGARGRVPAEPGAEETERGTGLLPGGTQQARRKKRREGKRAEYLVEDEETWMADEAANPDVVE
ncbi:uncharacterized protein YukE [Kitasatospora sp. GAS204A]|uniref:WXG100 family type VII secretion target n=1 Tax=unclassified Kitasatospora TaxID=2633591 RepID=UPI00247601BA|nr:WXG100 family type VII secretion target [Kitasatospora sp. GAS204B]MDH6121513.1 uncharacterized protein YukE [Kitasatospora sp. GAS204B]